MELLSGWSNACVSCFLSYYYGVTGDRKWNDERFVRREQLVSSEAAGRGWYELLSPDKCPRAEGPRALGDFCLKVTPHSIWIHCSYRGLWLANNVCNGIILVIIHSCYQWHNSFYDIKLGRMDYQPDLQDRFQPLIGYPLGTGQTSHKELKPFTLAFLDRSTITLVCREAGNPLSSQKMSPMEIGKSCSCL